MNTLIDTHVRSNKLNILMETIAIMVDYEFGLNVTKQKCLGSSLIESLVEIITKQYRQLS